MTAHLGTWRSPELSLSSVVYREEKRRSQAIHLSQEKLHFCEEKLLNWIAGICSSPLIATEFPALLKTCP